MAFTLDMPKLSPTMDEGTIAKWHVKEGDYVKEGALLLEITTDKATVEHTALDEGFLRMILIPEGKTASVNQPLAIFSENQEESIESFIPKEPKEPAKKETAPQAPATAETPAPTAQATLQEPAFLPEPPLESYSFEHPTGTKGRIKASPLAKKLAREQGLDLSTVKGTGPGGRITKDDLKLAQPANVVSFGKAEAPTLSPGSYEEIPLSPVRKVVAKRLQEAKSFVPHFYVKQVIDAEPLVSLREQLKALGNRVTFNDLVVRAAALTLRKHPEINAGYNSVNHTLIRFQTIDISVAASMEDGLITPIVRHADFKDVGQISVELKDLIARARKGKLAPHEYKGGSFCVSNLGMYGISEFLAVINPPQAAILAVGGIEEVARVRNGQLVAGKQMTLNLSVDHRVVDGADAAMFIKSLQHLLENPVALTI